MLGRAAPRGKGLYARGDLLVPSSLVAYLRAGKYSWVAVQPAHLRHGCAEALRAAGIPFWIFSTPKGDGVPSTPDSWLPSQYIRTVRAFEELALRHGARGYIADTETGWGAASREKRLELANVLLESARRTGLSVGLTTFYRHSIWRSVGPVAGAVVWLSLQMYEDRTPAQNDAIIAEANAAGWTVQVPSIGAYRHADDDRDGDYDARARTPAEWESSYADFPLVRGAVVWYSLPKPSGELAARIAAWGRFSAAPLVWAAGAALLVVLALGVALFIARRRG